MTILCRALLLLCVFGCSSAHAQLNALSYDRASSASFVASANAATGALGNLGAGSSGCCAFGAGANAFDPFSQRLYAFGPDPASAMAPWQLHVFNATTGTALPDVTLGQAGRIIGAAFEQVPPRLLALRAAAGGDVDLVEVDPASGALVVLNSGLPGCCMPTPNAVAYRAGVVYLSAQLRGSSTPTLFGFPVDGSAVTSVALVAPLTVLNTDPSSGVMYGMLQALSGPGTGATLSLVQVDSATGALTPIGSALVDCCALAPDVGAISSGSLTVVARPISASGHAFLSFDLGSGVASFSAAPVADSRIVNGLFDGAKGLEATTTTITSVVPEPSQMGQAYTVSVTVTATSAPVSGNVIVDDGIGGSCTFALPATACALNGSVLGPITITASYQGQGVFIGSSDTTTHNVVQATSTTAITSIVPAGSSPIGQPYTVNVAVNGFSPSGTVVVDDGVGANCSMTLPATNCVLTSNSIGPRTITASYAGDINNTPSSATAAYSIGQAPSVTTITGIVPAGSSVVGQPYTVSVSVSGFGTPVGTVMVDDGAGANCTIALPASSCALTSTVAGARTLTASYSGDTDNLPSSGTAAYTIDRAPSTTSITSVAPNPPTAGSAYSVSVSVSGFGTPLGAVTIDDGNGGSCVLNLPATACNLNSTVAGALSLTASYAGDANNLPSSGTFALVAQQAATTTTLSAAPDPAIIGMPVQLTASINQPLAVGVALGGSVDFLDGATPIPGCSAVNVVAGIAQCSTSFAATGIRNLQANYLGDANNLASTGTLDLAVDRVPTSTTLGVSPNPALSNTDVQLAIAVSGGVAPLSGTVSVTSNGVAIAECQNLVLVAGTTGCQFRTALEGQFTLVATYSGDVDDDGSSATAILDVGTVELPIGGRWITLLLGLGMVLLGLRVLRRT
ncbi:Ig-like domain-containing protein [Dokdonella immobilis]|uniref:Ig-like domain (Group 3) n=1 Tax=Dokdonella immobilis TaxID=578942 RepID=A0A1I4XNW3_9GAMM|nr:Ig-like domain-containing protein [Dokdonella immobilis]SFN27482.1 Ig-like domain (group 3) [Dokdonella immobilis]